MAKELVKAQGTSCIVNLDVVPGALKTELGKINEWRGAIQIRIAAQPREGEANAELVRFLSVLLGIPKGSIHIIKGGTSHHKVVVIQAPKNRIEKALGVSGC